MNERLNKSCSQVDCQHYGADDARVLGLCTGALAAAAVSCSRSTLELIPLAICAVTVAFRVGKHATDVAHRVASSDTSEQSWSMIVSGLTSGEAAVNNFCEQTVSTPTVTIAYPVRLWVISRLMWFLNRFSLRQASPTSALTRQAE